MAKRFQCLSLLLPIVYNMSDFRRLTMHRKPHGCLWAEYAVNKFQNYYQIDLLNFDHNLRNFTPKREQNRLYFEQMRSYYITTGTKPAMCHHWPYPAGWKCPLIPAMLATWYSTSPGLEKWYASLDVVEMVFAGAELTSWRLSLPESTNEPKKEYWECRSVKYKRRKRTSAP